MNQEPFHEPVLVDEVMFYLAPAPGKFIVDCNLGTGGHSLAILARMGSMGLLVGMDRDPDMLGVARQRIEAERARRDPSQVQIRLFHADHQLLPQVVADASSDNPEARPDGILFDLGPSTPQLLGKRGFSWQGDEPLDMRMDPTGPAPTAAEIVNTWDEAELARLIYQNADERWSRRIARRIIEERETRPIRTGRDLGSLVERAIPRKAWPPKTHPATRTFLALRIEVNQEYRTLEAVLPKAFELLRPGGRLVVISFHSGEDRRVKDFFRTVTTPPTVPWPFPQGNQPAPAKMLTRKPVEASPEETARNPRSRSAKLRAIEKNEL